MRDQLLEHFPVNLPYDDFIRETYESGLSDGFPFAVPEPALVEAAFAGLAVEGTEVLGSGVRTVTVADVVTATIVAGGRPEYAPTVVAAAAAMFDVAAERNVDALGGFADTAQCVVVSGPERERLGVHAGIGAFGPGWRANASIGRAVRLLVNWAFEPPLSAFGDPTQYSFCFGEDGSESPWPSLRVEHGIPAGESAVAVHAISKATKNFDRNNTDVRHHLRDLALFLRDHAGATNWFPDQRTPIIVVVGQEWHRQYVAAGWSKDDIRHNLYALLVADADEFGAPVQLSGPEDLTLIRAGGPAEAAEWCLIGTGAQPAIRNVDVFKKG